jgi:hypothetical protein
MADDLGIRTKRERAILPHADHVHERWSLFGTAVETRERDGARWARHGQRGDLVGSGTIRVDPLTLRVRDENVGPVEHTVTRVNAATPIEVDRDPLASYFFR